jgi:hypothetical protein
MYIAMLCLCQELFWPKKTYASFDRLVGEQNRRKQDNFLATGSILHSAAVDEGDSMPLLDRSARWAANRLPKVIGPKTHAVIDYAVAASFLGMAAFFWRRNQRAAVSCLFCGAAEALAALLTDYPGGITRSVSFENRRAIDLGLSGLVASVPGIMRFPKEPEARFFRMQGLALGVVTGLTDFTSKRETGPARKAEQRAA